MDLRPLYREMAKTGDNFQGLSIIPHRQEIAAQIRRIGARTLLDYGSGKGNAYLPPHEIHKDWGVERPMLYDPAFAEHDVLPPAGYTFDGVLCSDVLEHVPSDQVRRVIAELFALSNGFVWASVCCRAAKKSFPDGRNMHVTIQPLEWWEGLFKQAADSSMATWVLVETK